MPILLCAVCNNPFEPSKAWQKYCDHDCSQFAYLKRKIDKKKDNPLSVVEDNTGQPSEAQLAEWARRGEIAEQESERSFEEEEEERIARAKKIAREAEKLLEGKSFLEKWSEDK